MNVLVPLDGTTLSEAIFPWVRALLASPEVRVLLLHVSPVPDLEAEVPEGQPRPAPAECHAYVASAARRLGLSTDRIETRVLVGPIAPTIDRFAGERRVGLIAMRTSAREGLEYFLFGSTAAEVLGGTAVPVLMLGPGVPAREGVAAVRTMLVPLDGSEVGAAVLPIASTFARRLGASVTLFHARSSDRPVADLAPFVARLSQEGVPCEAVTADGDPAERILDRARTGGFDLIAMATHGLSGLRRLLLGSVAEAVLHAAPCPVLLTRPAESE